MITSPQRNALGQFLPGHNIGQAYRFKPGKSANPKGRPCGVNHWVRALRYRRYGRAELEAILASDDPAILPNVKEAAFRLIIWLKHTGRPST